MRHGSVPFERLPRRLFLDTSTLQTLQDYGEHIFEGTEIPGSDRIYSIPGRLEDVEALRYLMFINQRGAFEFALSRNSLREVAAKRDKSYITWAYDVLDYWETCLLNAPSLSEEGESLARGLDAPAFNYLGAGDRVLLRDAVRLDCHGFLTVELRLPRNAAHIHKMLRLRVLRPVSLWEMFQPWAGLFA